MGEISKAEKIITKITFEHKECTKIIRGMLYIPMKYIPKASRLKIALIPKKKNCFHLPNMMSVAINAFVF